jgi:hypothetical protein
MMATNQSSYKSGRTQIQRQVRIGAVLIVVMVALGYAAIPFVDHAVSSPSVSAQAASVNRTPGAVAPQQAMGAAAAADESLRSHVLKLGADTTDHSRGCEPDLGITTACVYN